MNNINQINTLSNFEIKTIKTMNSFPDVVGNVWIEHQRHLVVI